eukprot:12885850-Alexandrium_andersonii.AAC.1
MANNSACATSPDFPARGKAVGLRVRTFFFSWQTEQRRLRAASTMHDGAPAMAKARAGCRGGRWPALTWRRRRADM